MTGTKRCYHLKKQATLFRKDKSKIKDDFFPPQWLIIDSPAMNFQNPLEHDYIFTLIYFLGSLAQWVYSLVANKGDFSLAWKRPLWDFKVRQRGQEEVEAGEIPPFCPWIWYQAYASLQDTRLQSSIIFPPQFFIRFRCCNDNSVLLSSGFSQHNRRLATSLGFCQKTRFQTGAALLISIIMDCNYLTSPYIPRGTWREI